MSTEIIAAIITSATSILVAILIPKMKMKRGKNMYYNPNHQGITNITTNGNVNNGSITISKITGNNNVIQNGACNINISNANNYINNSFSNNTAVGKIINNNLNFGKNAQLAIGAGIQQKNIYK